MIITLIASLSVTGAGTGRHAHFVEGRPDDVANLVLSQGANAASGTGSQNVTVLRCEHSSAKMIASMNWAFLPSRSASVTPRATAQDPQT